MSLLNKIAEKTAVYGVVGLGYVGLPLMVEMGNAGNKVIGFDISPEKVEMINRGESYIPDVITSDFKALVASGTISATTDFSKAALVDAIAICVPTPLNDMKEPDVSFMVAATESIAPHITPETLVTLESTTYPGTTDEILKPLLEAHGLKVGSDIYLAYSPERVDPGNPQFQTKNTPKVVGGYDEKSTQVAVAFYESFLDAIVPVSSTRAAELTKILENTFRCVNIALVNEISMLCERMDINMWEVVDAAKTKPFGFMPFYPGPGLGGHCIPIDPLYLSWKAREFDFHTEFIDLATKINTNMPYYVIDRLMDALNEQGKALSTSRILVLGVAYKSNIDDMRETPAVPIINQLIARHANVVYHDPHVTDYKQDGKEMTSADLTAEEVAAADAVLILTAHRNVDYDLVATHAKLVLDTRNALTGRVGENIVYL